MIQGHAVPGFEPVRNAFERTFSEHVQVGAGLAVVREGEVLVDLTGGHRDPDATVPWTADTLVNVYSTTKGIGALLIARLVQAGELDYDASVVRYWPEFGAAGKRAVTVRQAISHEAGLAGLRDPLSIDDLYDWDGMVERLAAAEPLWPPGTAVGYHAITWAWIAGELIRRVSGRLPGRLLADEITGPMDLDLHIGLSPADDARVAGMIGPNRATAPAGMATIEPEVTAARPFFALAQQNPVIRPHRDVGSRAWRGADICSANGHATALALARLFGDLASPDATLLNNATKAQATSLTGQVEDLVLPKALRRAHGFLLNVGEWGPAAGAFGHDGAGGSVAFADPEARIGVGYVMNQMEPAWAAESRTRQLMTALYDCLADA